jgi:hypothetical protein
MTGSVSFEVSASFVLAEEVAMTAGELGYGINCIKSPSWSQCLETAGKLGLTALTIASAGGASPMLPPTAAPLVRDW